MQEKINEVLNGLKEISASLKNIVKKCDALGIPAKADEIFSLSLDIDIFCNDMQKKYDDIFKFADKIKVID